MCIVLLSTHWGLATSQVFDKVGVTFDFVVIYPKSINDDFSKNNPNVIVTQGSIFIVDFTGIQSKCAFSKTPKGSK